jgi:hypothetical protein
MAKWLKLSYQDAAPSAVLGASNHFEVAIATLRILFRLSSGIFFGNGSRRSYRNACYVDVGQNLFEDAKLVCGENRDSDY